MIFCPGPGLIKTFPHFSGINRKSDWLIVNWKAFLCLSVWSCMLLTSSVPNRFFLTRECMISLSNTSFAQVLISLIRGIYIRLLAEVFTFRIIWKAVLRTFTFPLLPVSPPPQQGKQEADAGEGTGRDGSSIKFWAWLLLVLVSGGPAASDDSLKCVLLLSIPEVRWLLNASSFQDVLWPEGSAFLKPISSFTHGEPAAEDSLWGRASGLLKQEHACEGIYWA